MSFLPLAVVWVMLTAAAAVLALTSRPRILIITSLSVPALSLLLWFLARPEPAASRLNFIDYRIAVNEGSWLLTGCVLLLLLAAVLHTLLSRDPLRPDRQPAIDFLLAAAALPALWAGDARTQALTISLFGVVWVATTGVVTTHHPERAGSLRRIGLWLGMVVSLLMASVASGVVGVAATMAASWLLVGFPPYDFRRAGLGKQAPLMHLSLPVLVGGALAAETLTSVGSQPGLLAVVTAVGLLSLLAGLFRLEAISNAGLARVLGPALGGLALVAGAWAGTGVFLSAIRLAVFVPALLMSAPIGSPNGDRRRLQPARVALAVAYLVLAGLPFLVGFPTLSGLYESWMAAGGMLLIAILIILLTIWFAIFVVVFRNGAGESIADGRRMWIMALPLIPLLPGLFSMETGLFGVEPMILLALIIPALAGIGLGWALNRFEEPERLLPELRVIPIPETRIVPALRQTRDVFTAAITEAAGIFEGENGILWLLALLLLLILAGG